MVDGRRIDGTGPTKNSAKTSAHDKLKRQGSKAKVGTLQALFDEWAKTGFPSSGLRATTFDQYVSLLRTWVIPALGESQVRDLTRKDVLDCMKTWTHSPSSQRSTYAAFVKLIDYAVTYELLAVNIVRQAPRPVASPPKHRDVPDDAFQRLLAASKEHRWQIAVWLAFAAGLRRGEILGLQWKDIDFDSERITITARGNITRSSQGLNQGPPKTRAGVRQVHVSPPLAKALHAHRQSQNEMRLSAPVWVDSDYVVTTHLGGAVEPRALSRAWRGWARAAKLPDKGTHIGRHYASTVMLASGKASIADIAAAMGHDPAVLLSTYAVAVAEGQRQATNVLGETLTRKPDKKRGVTSGVRSPRATRRLKDA